MLAKHLGRTPHAIQYFNRRLYSKTTKLKEWAKNDTKTEHYSKILKTRKELDIAIGI